MARERKLVSPVTLFAAIEQEQHEALRTIAFSERKSIADVAREALAEYIERHDVGSSSKARKSKVGVTRSV